MVWWNCYGRNGYIEDSDLVRLQTKRLFSVEIEYVALVQNGNNGRANTSR